MPHGRGSGRGPAVPHRARRGGGRRPLRRLLPGQEHLGLRGEPAPPPRGHRAVHVLRGGRHRRRRALQGLRRGEALHGLLQEAAGVQTRQGPVQGLRGLRVMITMAMAMTMPPLLQARERRRACRASASCAAENGGKRVCRDIRDKMRVGRLAVLRRGRDRCSSRDEEIEPRQDDWKGPDKQGRLSACGRSGGCCGDVVETKARHGPSHGGWAFPHKNSVSVWAHACGCGCACVRVCVCECVLWASCRISVASDDGNELDREELGRQRGRGDFDCHILSSFFTMFFAPSFYAAFYVRRKEEEGEFF